MKMQPSDKLKRDITRVAFEGFRNGKPLLDGNIGYELIQEDDLLIQIRVRDPGKGPRYFSVKVTEHI